MQTISKTKERKPSIKAAPPTREERGTARTTRAAVPVSLATRKRLAQAAAAAAAPASAAGGSAQKAKKDNAEDYVVVRAASKPSYETSVMTEFPCVYILLQGHFRQHPLKHGMQWIPPQHPSDAADLTA